MASEGPLVVRFFSGGAVVEAPLLPGRASVIGRGDDVAIALAEPAISRRHAMVVAEPGGAVWVEDLGSANGTSVDGRRLAPGARELLACGALLGLGDTLGTLRRGRVTGPARSEGIDALRSAVAAFAREPVSLCVFEGSGVDAALGALDALLAPEAQLVKVDARRVVCVVAADLAWANSWGRLVTTSLASRGVYLSFFAADATTDERAHARLLAAFDHPHAPPSMRALHAAPAPRVGRGMRRVFELVHHVAPTPTSVLIMGETGAGKEVIARTIHARSERASGPFVALNCAALPEALLEGELFGYEKGAFTGAAQAKPGLVETAGGGTLFLDEIGEMPLETQSKLLRVLEDNAVLRLGSVKPRPVSFRLLAATNRDVQQEIRARRFRADLYYRINGLTIRVPPLRERLDELDALIELFARRASEKLSRPPPELRPDVRAALHAYDWPGNVRELRNVVERLVLLSGGGVAELGHLPEEILHPDTPAPASARPSDPALAPALAPPSGAGGALTDDLARIERTRILDALDRCAGNQTRAAQMLGITRRVLIGRLERYGIARPRK